MVDWSAQAMVSRAAVDEQSDAARLTVEGLQPKTNLPNGAAALSNHSWSAGRLIAAHDHPQRVLILQGQGGAQAPARGGGRGSRRWRAGSDAEEPTAPLGWIPLGGFRALEWKAPFPRRVEAAMRTPREEGGLGLSDAQIHIAKTCLKSLATSRE